MPAFEFHTTHFTPNPEKPYESKGYSIIGEGETVELAYENIKHMIPSGSRVFAWNLAEKPDTSSTLF